MALASLTACVVDVVDVVASSSSSMKLTDCVSSSPCDILFSLFVFGNDSCRALIDFRDFLRVAVVFVLLLFVSVRRRGAELVRCFADELPSMNMTSSSTSRSPR